ncbi:MAG: tripartite tricarboxylate transporter substrate binding protein [Burkholderiales bacterium]|nr:tripartite tricarboxylate transporter substrate binding protein [Burkholderiales bacterium]
MKAKQWLGLVAAALALLPAAAQEFPSRTVRLIQPFPAGNVNDSVVRLIGDRFREATGQALISEYRPGAGGIIAAQTLLAAPADGYTMLLATSGMMSINPHTYSKLPYDPLRDFATVSLAIRSQMIFAGSASLPAATLGDFIAYARANPGKTSFASFTAGNPSHFAGVMLNQLAGIDMLHVAYKGTPPAVQDLLGGQVMSAFLPLISVKAHVEAGKLKAFAITGGERSPLMPAAPTFRELGYPQLEVYIWSGFVAPAATPSAVVQRLNREITAALRSPAAQQKLRAIDLEPAPNTPEAFARMIRADIERWESAIKASGFRAD